MATITGTINFVTGSAAAALGVTFVPEDTPQVLSSTMVIARDVRVALDASGALPAAFALQEGAYTVKLDNGEEFEIDVPSGSGTSDISTLVVSDGSAANTAYQASGHGSPEGVRRGNPGWTYLDVDTNDFYTKQTGTGTTGWTKQIGA